MKELSIEEKAKRYDEAIEIARKINSGDGVPVPPDWTTCEVIFPELKESEDERIREGLIQYFKDFTLNTFAGLDPKKILAWLEKQGEQKPYGQRKECFDCQFNYAGECKGHCSMKQGEQEPAWSEEDERMYRGLHNLIYSTPYCDSRKEFSDWLKSLKDRVQPKQEWSEEDEKIYQSIMDDTVQENQLNDKQTNWLRDIKYRYLPQPKQEWNVDDERTYRSVLYNFEHHFPLNCVQQEFVKSHIQSQNKWKPSEGQLECLGYVIEKAEKDWSPLTNNRIYLTLKELKEQLNKLRSDTSC